MSVLVHVHSDDLVEVGGEEEACRNGGHHLGRVCVVDIRLATSSSQRQLDAPGRRESTFAVAFANFHAGNFAQFYEV